MTAMGMPSAGASPLATAMAGAHPMPQPPAGEPSPPPHPAAPAAPPPAQLQAGAPQPPPSPPGILAQMQAEQTFQQACLLLKQDATTGFRIDIEADSTILPDEQQEKQDRTEFVQAMGQLLQQSLPLVQMQPALGPLIGSTIMFMVRGYKAGRALEEDFQKAIDGMLAAPPQQPQQKGGNEVQTAGIKAQAELQGQSMDANVKMQLGAQANSLKQQQVTGELALGAQREQREAAGEAERIRMEGMKIAQADRRADMRMLTTESRAADGLV